MDPELKQIASKYDPTGNSKICNLALPNLHAVGIGIFRYCNRKNSKLTWSKNQQGPFNDEIIYRGGWSQADMNPRAHPTAWGLKIRKTIFLSY